MLPVTVIVTVYHRVPEEQFEASVRSVMEQTVPVAEILVVADGPLTPQLDEVIERVSGECDRVRVLRLPVNRGLAVASQEGLRAASQPWAAKQDADDLSLPDRFERLAPHIEAGEHAVIGGAMLEFEGEPGNVLGIRRVPLTHEQIVRAARFNTPMNHPTIVMHVERVLAAGGYQSIHFLEDYDLYARLIARDERLLNLAEPLVLFRADPGMYARRRDRRLFAAEWEMQRRLRRYGLIGPARMLWNFAARSAVRLLPAAVFRLLHERVFRAPAPAATAS